MANEYTGSPLTRQQQIKRRKDSLWTARSPWDKRYMDISTNLLPFSGRFVTTDRNRGDKVFNNIIDESALFALNTGSAGMMSGTSSPARPWFRAGIQNIDKMEIYAVKVWLSKVTRIVQHIFANGNTYNALHTVYEELLAFNTACDVVVSDDEKVIWHEPLTVGEFALATDKRNRVNTLAREYEMTVEQIVEEFVIQPNTKWDWSKVSNTVKNMWDTNNYDKGVPIIHVIEPRSMQRRDLSQPYLAKLPQNLPFASCYIESACDNTDKILRESGYSEFPALCPRWHTRGGDVYGVGPGMNALGSIKQLQQEQMRKAQAIDYMARPPIAVPGELKGREIDALPGGMSFFSTAGGAKIQNLYDVRLDINALLNDIGDVRQRISKHFFSDLFLMISNDNRATPATATEIAERHEEKLLMIGPVLERLHSELLGPLVETAFLRALAQGLIPPPPPELEGEMIKIEFISVLAQAQRAIGLGALDRLLGTVGSLASSSGDQSVWDNIDKDRAVQEYADMLAVDPETMVAGDKIVMVRNARQDMQSKQAALQALPQAAQSAKAMAEAQQISGQGGQQAGTLAQFTGYTP